MPEVVIQLGRNEEDSMASEHSADQLIPRLPNVMAQEVLHHYSFEDLMKWHEVSRKWKIFSMMISK
jgi:hypothetical protein